MAVIWKRLPAAEAIDALADGSLPSIVPTTSGIYIWRRNFDCDPRVVASADSFTRWITDITRSPVAVVERKPLTHCVDLVGLIVGG